jgi:uncharacterized protein GlcG (DUF336 family)
MAATFERPSVTTALARAMIEAAERKAAEMGHPFVIAVAIGVSGGHYSQDMEVAQAGLSAVGSFGDAHVH